MNNKEACGAYFRQQTDLQRFFAELRKKWQSYGRCAGVVRLKDCSEAERKALGGMLGRAFAEPDVRIAMTEVEKALQDTRFAPVTLQELLEAYFQEEIISNSSRRQRRQTEREAFFSSLYTYFRRQEADGGLACRWYEAMQHSQAYGYQVLMREWERDQSGAARLAREVGDGLNWAVYHRQEELPIAVLAARITGNPHCFDRGTAAGTLLTHSLCFAQQQEFPGSAVRWKELLAAAGILPDDIASTVIAYQVHLVKNGVLHAGAETFWRLSEPLILTSVNLTGCQEAFGEKGSAYVVENEMVFRYLYERVRESRLTLLCTSGQMRAAAQELIRLLAASGTTIHYSGDMDPEGIGIADRLWRQYPEQVRLWRMAPEDYQTALSREGLAKKSLMQLESLEHPRLLETAAIMKKKKRAAYQENLLKELLKDLRKAGGEE